MSAERTITSDYRGQYILTYVTLLNNEKSLYINEIVASHKGCGYGSSLLQEILDKADNEHISICLHANCYAFDEQGLNQDELERWYFRNGFNRVYNLYPSESTNFFYREAN